MTQEVPQEQTTRRPRRTQAQIEADLRKKLADMDIRRKQDFKDQVARLQKACEEVGAASGQPASDWQRAAATHLAQAAAQLRLAHEAVRL